MRFFYLLIFIFYALQVNSKNLNKSLSILRNNEFHLNKVYEDENFFFSQISYNWSKYPNRKFLSRAGTIESIRQFKKYFIEKNIKANLLEYSDYGLEAYLSNKLSSKDAIKIEDRKFRKYYLIVMAFPKNKIQLNTKSNFKLNELITFTARNHYALNNLDRNNFLKKLELNDLMLLWKINEIKKSVNLTNYVGKINPVIFQIKIQKIIKKQEFDLKYLNDVPSFKLLVEEHLNRNMSYDKMTFLSIKTSICSHNNNFKIDLEKNNIETYDGSIMLYNSSFLNVSLTRCSGFMNFDKLINLNINHKLQIIKKKFNSGKNLDEIIRLIEKTVEQNPNNFQLWNFYSACLRAKKQFRKALIISRVEINIALEQDNEENYIEGLKSYSKAIFNLNKYKNIKHEAFFSAFL